MQCFISHYIQCLLYEFVLYFYFLLFLLLKMSGPLGPRTCSLMQKGAVFHFTLHCCNTVLMTILFIIQCLLYEFVSYFSLFLPLKMSGPLGPHTYIQMQKGAVFHFTLHSMFTVWVCLILFTFHFSLSVPLKMSGPLGPRTYIQMQKGTVFHFTLHAMFTVWVCLILFTLFTFKNVRSTGPTYLYTNAEGCKNLLNLLPHN